MVFPGGSLAGWPPMERMRGTMKQILYGAAYYDEYMPVERLETDMEMMKKAGINVIRIAESTWASEEPEEGVFDFSHVRRSIEAAAVKGISVIVGTPTYAVPPWLAHKCPDILAVTETGRRKYGARQNMDITNPEYLFYAERIIRKLMECVCIYDNVIGIQLDNETKHYHVAGEAVQKRFVTWLQNRFGTVEALNREFGFAYWSNAVDCWEHVPDVTGTINGSFWAEFEKFRRSLVAEFLLWQRGIVEEYLTPGQFITHNFDYEWRDFSYGVQPDVEHDRVAEAVTVAGCDIYHPTQHNLTGREITFCGNLARSLKKDNDLVLETQAQGHVNWTPYDGQLRLQAFSHLANGADGVLYWHWHSLHNGCETYWRGILGHDLQENRLYREVLGIGRDLERIGDRLLHLKKENQAAILVSNESLTALGCGPVFPLPDPSVQYNDIVRQYADALYRLNVEYDVVWAKERDFSAYRLLIVPALYSASEELLKALVEYVRNGGTLLTTFKSGYADESLKVYHHKQPHILRECLGVSYQEYTVPSQVGLAFCDSFAKSLDREMTLEEKQVKVWMELLEPEGADILAEYDHPFWKGYAALTEHSFGEGKAIYAGCLMTDSCTEKLVTHAARTAGLQEEPKCHFPVVIKSGVNQYGRKVHYYLNYSGTEQTQAYRHNKGKELLSGKAYDSDMIISLQPWQVCIFEEDTR